MRDHAGFSVRANRAPLHRIEPSWFPFARKDTPSVSAGFARVEVVGMATMLELGSKSGSEAVHQHEYP
jgi:hypothetical protein